MKVKELIKMLQEFDSDMEVLVTEYDNRYCVNELEVPEISIRHYYKGRHGWKQLKKPFDNQDGPEVAVVIGTVY